MLPSHRKESAEENFIYAASASPVLIRRVVPKTMNKRSYN